MPEPQYVERFSRTERSLHWVHAAAFLVMLGSGLVLYVPRLSELVGRRPFVKDVHVYTAVAWVAAIALVVVLGDRRGLRKTLGDLDGFDRDDRLWLRRLPVAQGRFNAGQKLNAALTGSFAVLFLASGGFLWLGERDTRFRFASTILLHDGLMYVSLFLLVGHLYLTLIYPATRHSLRGMTKGSVDAHWAWRHHRKWMLDRPES
ncbi:MAG: formate dehydrogenase subunit gamma [Gaiellaceae bacterium]|jgi:formate dehydrogenase subunit gamma|nr:formate dehydrogenase subunit gamma [Gaiellaceae bacterium]